MEIIFETIHHKKKKSLSVLFCAVIWKICIIPWWFWKNVSHLISIINGIFTTNVKSDKQFYIYKYRQIALNDEKYGGTHLNSIDSLHCLMLRLLQIYKHHFFDKVKLEDNDVKFDRKYLESQFDCTSMKYIWKTPIWNA